LAALGTIFWGAEATGRPHATSTAGKASGRSPEVHAPQTLAGWPDSRVDRAPAHVRSDIERFALNYLLLPLIDDTVPKRWVDPSLGLGCGGASQVLVDGQPVVAGALLPTKDFALQFLLSRCSPAVEESLEFHGAIDMRVSHAPGQLRALVQPRDLIVLTAQGRTGLTSPFTACLALDEAAACDQPAVVIARTGY
jgi:hypothetical protein